MDQMTQFNVKGAACSVKPAVPLSSTELFSIFQLIVLGGFFLPVILLFWFTLTSLINQFPFTADSSFR